MQPRPIRPTPPATPSPSDTPQPEDHQAGSQRRPRLRGAGPGTEGFVQGDHRRRQPQGPPGRVGNGERRHAAGQRGGHVLQRPTARGHPAMSRPTILAGRTALGRWRARVPRPQPAAADRLDHHGNQARDRGPPGRFAGAGILPAHAGLYGRRRRRRTRFYDRFGVSLLQLPATNPNPYAYGVVPDSYTQMDQLKISGRLTEDNQVYAFLMAGNTVNQEIDMNRWFNDMDVRLDEHLDRERDPHRLRHDLQRSRADAERGHRDGREPGPDDDLGTNTLPTSTMVTAAFDQPIDYHKSTAGLKGVWRPGGGGYAYGGLAIIGGYEYCDLERPIRDLRPGRARTAAYSTSRTRLPTVSRSGRTIGGRHASTPTSATSSRTPSSR